MIHNRGSYSNETISTTNLLPSCFKPERLLRAVSTLDFHAVAMFDSALFPLQGVLSTSRLFAGTAAFRAPVNKSTEQV
jgi:hypothetical protein